MFLHRNIKNISALFLIFAFLTSSMPILPFAEEGEVLQSQISDEEALYADKEALSIGFTKCVSRDLILPTEGKNGSSISWRSSHPEIIGHDGKFTVPERITQVTLTATLKKGGYKTDKVFVATANDRSMYDVIKDYVDVMMKKGRDIHDFTPEEIAGTRIQQPFLDVGRKGLQGKSGLFFSLLERDTLKYPAYFVKSNPLKQYNSDERGSVCMVSRDLWLYELCYVFTDLTDDKKYEKAADEALYFFLTFTQNEKSGLLPWGLHNAYDPVNKGVNVGNQYTEIKSQQDAWNDYLEYGPGIARFLNSPFWVNKFLELNRDATIRWLESNWKSHIGDKETFFFGRHVSFDGGPITGQYFSWATLYFIPSYFLGWRLTKSADFLQAMESMLRWMEKVSSMNKYDIHPTEESYPRNRFHEAWDGNSYCGMVLDKFLPLAPDLPDHIKDRFEQYAERMYDVFWRPEREYDEEKGFADMFVFRTGLTSRWKAGIRTQYMDYWRMLKDGERKTKLAKNILHSTDNFHWQDFDEMLLQDEIVASDINTKFLQYLAAYEISKDVKYLHRALEAADFAIYVFWDKDGLLPSMSYAQKKYYESSWGNPELAKYILDTYLIYENYKKGIEMPYRVGEYYTGEDYYEISDIMEVESR